MIDDATEVKGVSSKKRASWRNDTPVKTEKKRNQTKQNSDNQTSCRFLQIRYQQDRMWSHETQEETVQHLKSSSCCPHILPTGIFESVFNRMASDLLQIVNTSLLSFPTGPAVIRPLLKKNNLANSLINNFRPKSNLPFYAKSLRRLFLNSRTPS